ncbi:Alcohol dehydrogenase superfamily, zinc-type [Ascosphaera apis ARSEF 7405]|uniref:Alcohol dehydrogenase superfamily, zinc-type n=1 Tax=Ascosphaera apis ARSEF 7405 TaxID=392613 RepID=A0A166P2S1_9EURO|nr:Alcohol dehydrogenase superfamily, zinc-type [Ascosphaera apis ARSEF 7405]
MATQFEIPKTCKAGVVVNEGPDFTVEVVDVPVPEPGPDEVLLRLNVTGLCYSDVHFMLNDIGLGSMTSFGVRSPGHEGAGVVVKVGSNVKHIKVGDRGGIKPIWDVCGNCKVCWTDQEAYCPKSLFAGIHVPGTYQHYITSPAKYLSPIPDGVPDELAAPIMCSASTILRSITESQLRAGEWAVFCGAGGGVGIQGVQIAKAMGLRPIAIDTGADKRELCMKMGAEHFIDFKEVDDVAQAVVKVADGVGAHGVFITADGAYKNAVAMIGSRIGGKVMCVALPTMGSQFIGSDPCNFVYSNLQIKGTMVGCMRDTDRALEFAERGLLNPIIAEKYPVSKFPEAVARLKAKNVPGRLLIDFNME